MFISRTKLNNLISKVDTLERDRDGLNILVRNLRQTVASVDREIEELAENQRYDRGIPLVEVVKALVKESGKEPTLVEQVPAKIVLMTELTNNKEDQS